MPAMTESVATETTELTPELIEQVRRLSPNDRERLFELADGPPFPHDPELQAELQRRWDAFESGADQARPMAELFAELRAKHGVVAT